MKAFSTLFALLAIGEFIGFATGHKHCIYPAILIGALSAFIWWQSNKDNYSKSSEFKRERRSAWIKQGKCLKARG